MLSPIITHTIVLSIPLVLAIYIIDNLSELFIYHPVLMLLGYGILMSEGIIFSRYIKTKQRAWWLQFHLIIQTAALLIVLVAFFVEVKNKFDFGKMHFRSYHAWFGLAAVIFTTIQTTAGYVIYFFRKEMIKIFGVPNTVKLCRLHGTGGTVVYGISMVALMFGFRSNFAISKFGFGVANILIFVFLVITIIVLLFKPHIPSPITNVIPITQSNVNHSGSSGSGSNNNSSSSNNIDLEP